MKKMNKLNLIILSFSLGLSACSPTQFSSEPESTTPPVDVQTLEPQEKDLAVAGGKADILIISDNSESMREKQANMAQRMSHLLEQIQDLDWRIAVTTTDPEHPTWGDGNLLPMMGIRNSYFYSSHQDPKLAQKIIGDTIERSETGSSSEQGVLATYRMLERARQGLSPNKDFLREDANFIAIVISDEDESGRTAKNNPVNLVNYFKAEWPTKKFVFHSIIVKPGDVQCQSVLGHEIGNIYAMLSKLTGMAGLGGAIIGSVCENDYGTQLKGMGKSIMEMYLAVELDCVPVGEGSKRVLVYKDQSDYTEKFKVEGKQVIFERPLPMGGYRFKYSCKKKEKGS